MDDLGEPRELDRQTSQFPLLGAVIGETAVGLAEAMVRAVHDHRLLAPSAESLALPHEPIMERLLITRQEASADRPPHIDGEG
jgi:hypothetical protein